MYSSISADIISSSLLPNEDWMELIMKIKDLLQTVEKRYEGSWCRIVRGDTIECVFDHPHDAFEVSLILKSFVKAYSPTKTYSNSKTSRRGLKITIGVGSMNTIDRQSDIMDGEAIYRSGRSLNDCSGWSQYGFIVNMPDKKMEEPCQLILSLINHIINSATPRQCATLYHQLLHNNVKMVGEIMGISYQGVYNNLAAMGWLNIEKALSYLKSLPL